MHTYFLTFCSDKSGHMLQGYHVVWQTPVSYLPTGCPL